MLKTLSTGSSSCLFGYGMTTYSNYSNVVESIYFRNSFNDVPAVFISPISEFSVQYWNWTIDYVSNDRFRALMIGNVPSVSKSFVYLAIGK